MNIGDYIASLVIIYFSCPNQRELKRNRRGIALKIGFTGIELPEGKLKYKDERVETLVAKDKPKKVTPFYVEFIRDEFVKCEAIVVAAESVLDLLILDIEKCETRLERSEEDAEKALMQKCMTLLEEEIPLCNGTFSEEEHGQLAKLAPVSYKPVVIIEGSPDPNVIISLAFDKADMQFFYTSGPKEVHAWPVKKGSDIVTCAGKIHKDLARGFIKGDVVSFDDYLACHNFNDCRKKGVVQVVDREHVVNAGDIIEIRFNV